MDFVTFFLNDSVYGIDTTVVKEVIPLVEIAPASEKMPFYVQGVINLRGEIITVIDLLVRMGWERKDFELKNSIIIARQNHCTVGLIVDRVQTVLSVNDWKIKEHPTGQNAQVNDCVSKVGVVKNKIIFILDIKKVLGDE